MENYDTAKICAQHFQVVCFGLKNLSNSKNKQSLSMLLVGAGFTLKF